MPSSYNLVLSSNDNISSVNNELKIRLPIPFTAKKCKIALSSVNIYYSWFNLTSAYNNLACRYVWTDGITYNVNFPAGFYTVSDLNGYLQLVMKNNGHYLVDANGDNVYYLNLTLNPVYYAVTLTCSAIPNGSLPSGYSNPNSVVLNGKVPQLGTLTNNFGRLIGFASGTFFPSSLSTVAYQTNSTLTPIISPVTNVNIGCNWVNNSRFSKYPTIISTFTPNVQFGSLISFYPPVLNQYDVIGQTYSDISINFYDQNFNALVLNDTNQIQVTLQITTDD